MKIGVDKDSGKIQASSWWISKNVGKTNYYYKRTIHAEVRPKYASSPLSRKMHQMTIQIFNELSK